MKIETISIDNPLFEEVKKLGKRNSTSLGHMPDGGFEDYAMNNGIIGAHENGILYGYLMFRKVYRNNRINIVHLCVNTTTRRHGIATQLLHRLIEKFNATNFRSLELHCRDDYRKASQLWSKIGFVAVNDKRSKSKVEHSLIHWVYTLKSDNSIFAPTNYPDAVVKALLDTNIIVRLRDHANSELDNPLILFADSIYYATQYFVSDETYSETLRDENQNRSKLTRNYIQSYQRVSASSISIIQLSKDLKNIIAGESVNDESDRRNIATCIVNEIPYLLTFDIPLISKSDAIELQYGVKIMHPTQFVVELDSLQNKDAYNPTFLQGSMYHTVSKIEVNELKTVQELFYRQKQGENYRSFKSTIFGIINKQHGRIKVVRNGSSIIGVIGVICENSTMDVPLIRVEDSKKGKYLFMHLVSDIISYAISEHVSCIHISEPFISELCVEIPQQMGFMAIEGVLTKYINDKVIKYDELASLIKNKENSINISVDSLSAYDIEKLFFPLKISDSDIPSYIIPIKPYWAQSLFDHIEASLSLFGVDTVKLWNIENVYYRSIRPNIEKSGARILWYVSDDHNSSRRKGIVASSYLDQVHIGEAKRLFERFKHYGVYDWSNIMDLTNHTPSTIIKALIFSHTEVFQSIVPLNLIREILGNKNMTFQSPYKISAANYFRIYEQKNGRI